MLRSIKAALMGLAVVGLVTAGADSAWARGGGGGGSRGGGGGGGGRSFSSGARTFSSGNWNGGNVSGRTWNGGNVSRNWSGNSWNGGGNWNGGWNHNNGNWHWNGNQWVWAVAPLVYGALGYGWGGYGYGYGYGYPYYNNYYYGYPNYGYYSSDSYSPSYYSQPAYSSDTYSQPAYSQPAYSQSTATGGQDQYLGQAVQAFQSGNYREAERLARHAAVDMANSPDAHLVLCLTAFANGDERTAADEARAVIELGGMPSWSHIYAYYQNVDRYTSQLRALETKVDHDPRNADGQFLLGFLYLANGYRSNAQEHLAIAQQDMPTDRIVGNLLSQAGGSVPTTAARPSYEGSTTAPMNNNIAPPMNNNIAPPSGTAPPTNNHPPARGAASPQSLPQPPAVDQDHGNAPSGNVEPPPGEPPAAPTADAGGTRT